MPSVVVGQVVAAVDEEVVADEYAAVVDVVADAAEKEVAKVVRVGRLPVVTDRVGEMAEDTPPPRAVEAGVVATVVTAESAPPYGTIRHAPSTAPHNTNKAAVQDSHLIGK